MSPYLIKNINVVEKVQRSFTRFISVMKGLSYPERLTALKLYSLQRRREKYIIICVWKILEGLVPKLFPPICTKTSDRRGRTCIMSRHFWYPELSHWCCSPFSTYILSVYSPFSDRVGLPLHNIHNPSPFTSIMDIFISIWVSRL